MNGKNVVSNDVPSYGPVQFASANTNQRLVNIGTETNTVAIRALPSNGGLIYVGFDDQVDVNNGFPLQAGDSISVEIDANQQGLWVLTDNAGDELRYIVLS